MAVSADLEALAARALEAGRARGLRVATAESCTGGLVAAALTTVPGSSDVFERGWVTYSDEAKHELLGVPEALIAARGAVSEEVAAAMVAGALARSTADAAVSVTGVAGPDGGTDEKPVGHVVFGVGARGGPIETHTKRFGDLGRNGVRLASVAFALELLLKTLSS